MSETTARITYNEQQATQGYTGALGTNREDLGNVVWDVSPTETPGLSAMGKNAATGVGHDWITDALADAGPNKNLEGADAVITRAASRVRLSNYTQILDKTAEASGTQEKVLKGGGIKSELAYQTARRIREMKRDAEYMIYGGEGNHQAKVLGAEATDREFGGFESYMNSDTWTSLASSPTAPTGDGTDVGTPGTSPQAFTEDAFKAALTALWDRSGGTENPIAIMGSAQRSAFSTFDGSNTRYVTTDDRKLTASIDIYDGDYHTVTAVPDRFCDPGAVFLQDNEYIKLSELRPMFTQDLAIVGDARRKQVLWEFTLEVSNPDAQGMIVGLSTA